MRFIKNITVDAGVKSGTIFRISGETVFGTLVYRCILVMSQRSRGRVQHRPWIPADPLWNFNDDIHAY